MRKLQFFLLTTSIMVVSSVASAQKAVSFIAIDDGTRHSISLDSLAKILENSDSLITGEFADKMMEIYDTSFPSYSASELAVLVLKSTITDDVIFIQQDEKDKVHSFRILSKDLGWLKANRKARKNIEKIIPKNGYPSN